MDPHSGAAATDALVETPDWAGDEETHDRSRLRSWPGIFGGIHSIHLLDEAGNPAGGETYGRGFTIDWQDGPLLVDGVRQEPSGACVEDLLEAVLDRMRFYQEAKFSSRHNALTITKVEEALLWQRERTRERQLRGVEGTHQV